jgi:hypothetical protein
MIEKATKDKIIEIWRSYTESNQENVDSKGNVIPDFDQKRLNAILDIKEIINAFLKGKTNIFVFKTAIDSYNKKNNLWGFTAIKGQMFFNQLTNSNENSIEELTSLLKRVISEPNDLKDAIQKIGDLEMHVRKSFDLATDKRKVPNPKSCNYFLSYFWQIQNPDKWAIMYSSLVESLVELNIWEDKENQAESYKYFFNLNEEIKDVLSLISHKRLTNWEVEHIFWNYQQKTKRIGKIEKPFKKQKFEKSEPQFEMSGIKASFELSEYLIPKVANLVEIGNDDTKSASAKGSKFESLVSDIFKFLDFDVQVLGQGSGRNPDAILRLREVNTAFLVDAKAYTKGYSLGIDDRAIREYINHYCPALNKDGYHKIGFIIVSNSFNSNFDSFINEITWNTPIKRFILMTSEALLYLLAYKLKNNLSATQIVENIISCGNHIEAQNIIEEFEDV